MPSSLRLRSAPTALWCVTSALWLTSVERLKADDRGEGVISAAIVVLIMAFLGAAMWAAFKVIFDDATEGTRREVAKIGG